MASQNSSKDKDNTYWKVVNSAIELELSKGHLRWTLSDLSRKSKVTRSLIYYYFGRSKLNILLEAVRIIGEEFIGLSQQRLKLWDNGEYKKSLEQARLFYEQKPHLCLFYLTHRFKKNEIGSALQAIEKSFKKKIKSKVPNANSPQINALFAVYFGIAFAPEVTEAEISVFTSFMKTLLKKMNK